ncbi:energy transducer TonB [Mucilaginibacter sp. HMF5004]|uniref:energy transducer TonB n=1 Tax=Mucilaginibacter rivuli TaxID=2857527 RepID=UPI001C601324|nr:energy transducer TonB [Mucilaginibacter rivuli]MBW4888341.1 energy transducer TonB [Mucilaginibacter rivuli]
MKDSGKQVSTRDSADFIRIVSEPDSGLNLYNIKEYFPQGNIKLIGRTSKIEPPVLEGQCITYFPSGKRKTDLRYSGGKVFGDAFEYFPNGKLYAAKKYPAKVTGYVNDDYLIDACNDSTGKALVTDGNGHYVGYNDGDFKRVFEEGDVKAGLKDGEWKGSEENKYDTIRFVEHYANGKIISGAAIDKNKKEYRYTKRNVEPEFRGGESALYRYLGYAIRYPNEAKENGIQGRVILKFIVEKDGSVANIEILKSPDSQLTQEAIRVLKNSPKWTPGMMYGRNVRVLYTLPVNFALN